MIRWFAVELSDRRTAMPARVGAAVLSVAVLSACADANMGSLLTPAATPAATTSEVAATTAPAPPRADSGGRADQSAAAQSLTPEQINAECWMSVESNKKVRDIDQRLKLVDKCVEERTRGRQGSR